MLWLPEPPAGTSICLGFDGSDVDDWTALRAETRDGFMFTPRYGPEQRATIWNPAAFGGQIPRLEVHEAVAEVFERFDVRRMYCDPPRWESDVETWALRFNQGRDVVAEWPTYRTTQMHAALERFVTDLRAKRITHDGCPLTSAHIANARKVPKGDRYILSKPNQAQKIDAAMANALAHEAASDERAAGWERTEYRAMSF